MKAIRKSDGKIIEVETYMLNSRRSKDGSWESSYKDINSGLVYEASDLDFSVNEAKEAEGAVLSGWVARDSDGNLSLFEVKPERVRYMRNNNEGLWMAKSMTEFVSDSFPDLTWDSEPIEVEITIKPKKK